jgi:SAM-dependent methyltransferase
MKLLMPSFVLCCVKNVEATVDEICKLLKPGGKLYFFEYMGVDENNYPFGKIINKVFYPFF